MNIADLGLMCKSTGNKSFAVFLDEEKIIGWTRPEAFDSQWQKFSQLAKLKPNIYMIQAKPSTSAKIAPIEEMITPDDCVNNITLDQNFQEMDSDGIEYKVRCEFLERECAELKAKLAEAEETIAQLEADMDQMAEDSIAEDSNGLGSFFGSEIIQTSAAQLLQSLALKFASQHLNTTQNDVTATNNGVNGQTSGEGQ